MPHMLAQEHMGYVDALRYGTVRTQVTWAAALSAIGSTPTTLVLTNAGDGVWSLGASLTSPTNVTTFIPPGVTVNVGAGFTWTSNGPVISYNPNWKTGTGTVVLGTTTPLQMSAMKHTQLILDSVTPATPFRLYNSTLTPQVGVDMNIGTVSGNAVPSIVLVKDPAVNGSNWGISNNLLNTLYIARVAGLANLALNNTGLWVGNGSSYTEPAHLLHLQLDDAFKPGDASWDFPSDSRLKTVQRAYTDGLAMLLALPDPIVYTYNGKAETLVDGHEYIGMLGQDVQAVAPYMIKTYPAKLEPADAEPTDILSMNNSAMVYALRNAIKEQQALIVALTTRVTALETALTALTDRVTALETP